MRNIFLLILLSHPLAQQAQLITCGGIASYEVFNFDGGTWPDNYTLEIERSGKNNCWETGIPKKKKNIKKAHSVPGLIITKRCKSYPPNNVSSFIIRHTDQGGYSMPHTARLSGYYNVNSDSLNDYGTIEISPDSGKTWISLISDTVYQSHYHWITPKPVLTGNSNGWQKFEVSLAELGKVFSVKSGATILFRFSFISDSKKNKLDGLAYDNLQFCDGAERARPVKNDE
jgi:hypothetical protein